MATVPRGKSTAGSEQGIANGTPGAVYDRSSLVGDYMVMIAGQTAEDFERKAPEDEFCEYFDGVVYMPSPVTDRHQKQVGFLHHLIHGFWCEHGGEVLSGPAVLRLQPEWKPEPNLFVRPTADRPAPQPPAWLVVEFHSPSTRQHDLQRKRKAYRAVGIPNIWMVDDRDRVLRADVLRHPDGRYTRLKLGQGFLPVRELPGFWIDVAWLWEDPLPNARRCLERILAGPPA